MNKLNIIPKRWRQAAALDQLPTPQDGPPLVSGDALAIEVLRFLPPFIFRPDVVALVCIDAGLHLSGEQVLRLAQIMTSTYGAICDGLCGDLGEYALPKSLLVADDPLQRARVVDALDKVLILHRQH